MNYRTPEFQYHGDFDRELAFWCIDRGMTTIQEGLQHSRKQVQAEEAIAERYPDARIEELPGNTRAWASPQVLADATDLQVLTRSDVMVTLSVEVQGVQVLNPSYMGLHTALDLFKKESPDGYRRFVQIISEATQARQR